MHWRFGALSGTLGDIQCCLWIETGAAPYKGGRTRAVANLRTTEQEQELLPLAWGTCAWSAATLQ